MRKILISINPEHVKNIINGTKRYEYRTRVAKQDINSIIVYSTFPTKRIVAEVEIDGIIEDTPEGLWKSTTKYSGIKKEFFDQYFKDRKKAYAYILGKINVFEIPLELKDYGITHAPQSYIYI